MVQPWQTSLWPVRSNSRPAYHQHHKHSVPESHSAHKKEKERLSNSLNQRNQQKQQHPVLCYNNEGLKHEQAILAEIRKLIAEASRRQQEQHDNERFKQQQQEQADL